MLHYGFNYLNHYIDGWSNTSAFGTVFDGWAGVHTVAAGARSSNPIYVFKSVGISESDALDRAVAHARTALVLGRG
jgi:hypothetical protein